METVAKSAARAIGSQVGREIIRGGAGLNPPVKGIESSVKSITVSVRDLTSIFYPHFPDAFVSPTSGTSRDTSLRICMGT